VAAAAAAAVAGAEMAKHTQTDRRLVVEPSSGRHTQRRIGFLLQKTSKNYCPLCRSKYGDIHIPRRSNAILERTRNICRVMPFSGFNRVFAGARARRYYTYAVLV